MNVRTDSEDTALFSDLILAYGPLFPGPDVQAVTAAWTAMLERVPLLRLGVVDEASCREATRLIDALMPVVGEQAGHPLGGLLELLVGGVSRYESLTFPVPPVSPLRLMAFMLEQQDLTPARLAERAGLSEARTVALLAGADMTVMELGCLARALRLAPRLLLGD